MTDLNTSFHTFDARELLGRGSRRNVLRLDRIRYQLPLLILFAVCVPLFLRNIDGTGIDQKGINSAIVTAIAVVFSFFLWRRLKTFPGSHPVVSALWAVLVGFGVVAVFILFLRADYSRTVFFAAPAIVFFWLATVSMATSRTRAVQFGVIDGGKEVDLPMAPSINWVRISDPADIPKCDAYVADLRHDHSREWEGQIVEWTLHGIPVYHTKQIVEHITGRMSIDHLSENTFGSVLPNLNYLVFKRISDLVAVALLAVPAILLGLIVAGAILVVDGRPVLFKQRRIGFRGKPFMMYKFRSMSVRPETTDGSKPELTQKKDPRVTTIGRYLRKFRLDEIPQLYNIAKGEMSLIGPRPEAEALGLHYEEIFPFYRYRYAVKPGITGWAQVSQGHVIDDEDVRVKLEYDFYYVKNISFWLDFNTVLKTLHVVFFGRGAK